MIFDILRVIIKLLLHLLSKNAIIILSFYLITYDKIIVTGVNICYQISKSHRMQK
jgi:hypothetical protein